MDKFQLTQAQADDLFRACANAREPGHCRYVTEEGEVEPLCVVGQLLHIRGFDLEAFRTRRGDDGHDCIDARSNSSGIGVIFDRLPEIHEYPEFLLAELQSEWDSAKVSNRALEDIARNLVEII